MGKVWEIEGEGWGKVGDGGRGRWGKWKVWEMEGEGGGR